ncbi:glucose-6-phosphate 1-dehydrogenase [Ameyamaea chiangmaiensis NBRC 103196]|uniref:Glucose-6-phosphate 1-dehydrogenase n=1 Tax=Ameyamaea chiangmaiensis TaxID=442969 RepID=A0A850PJY9_9PROT|nr:glucose-6-phosphate dehydrogenase [Ameyamaea chiangmaiensis]MBS4074389.1 glucose-6-phosphate dehydrogenase [Ameyamaea chiangmaiensis]NVN41611.1 glucose-6-phosphate dehydrogenase [Ameyamaea chiangmaiensis]GBQ71871.1 glucose-6-phosphate 1-dehydrogenase [Ameyamaea chiangmaiensis NBRC 103196]
MSQLTPVDVFDYVVFGATGDLTMRKLLPALFYRFRDGQVPAESRIIGTARSKLSTEEYRGRARDALTSFVRPQDQDGGQIDAFLDLVHYASLNGAEADSTWSNLTDLLDHAPADRIRVYYLATAPNLYGAICENLHNHSLVTDASRVVLEKPIGVDLDTANAINDGVGRFFPENHIFRIDHYLGKETVQALIALRFANPVFERLWSSDAIDYVQITAAETVGVEGRAGYYDTSGALRDMIQNHLLQVLTLVAMEPPGSLDADLLRNEKLKVLHALKPIARENVAQVAVRGQYVRGDVNGQTAPGYLEDLGEGKTSSTETYVALKAEIQNWRWAGVPFYLRSGKRLRDKVSEVVIQFKSAPWSIFPAAPRANRLIIRIQPNEGVMLAVSTKDPAKPDSLTLREADIDISFGKAFATRYPDAYERLLLDAVRGDPVLFIRRDEVEAAWRFVMPVLEAWSADQAPLESYPAGSWGPKAAQDLLAASGHAWHEDQG